MFKAVLLLTFLIHSLWGGLLDFQTLEQAQKSYNAGDFNASAQSYESLEKSSDALHYNLGNAYYKEKRYEDAIKEFTQVNEESLKAKALHNLGNAYAQTQKTKEAIKAYKEALKLGDDEDTKFNLELLKKEQEKKENQKKQDQDKEDQENKDKEKSDQEKSDEEKKKDKESQTGDEDEKSDEEQKSQESQEKSDQEKKEQKQKEAEEAKEASEKEDEKQVEEQPMQAGEQQAPISDMQERKYEQMLDKRGIKTLMVPIKTEGGSDEENSAW